MVSDDFSGEAKQDSSWGLPLTIIGVTLLLSFGFVYYYFGPTLNQLQGNAFNPSASGEVISLKIGETSFSIPTNYTQYDKVREGGVQTSVDLYALLPDFEPYSQENIEAFDDNSADSPVIYFEIGVFQSALEESQRLENVYLKNVVDPNGRAGPYGLTTYEFTSSTGYRNQDLFVFKEKGKDPVVIRCHRESDLVPSPHCRRDLKTKDGLALSYRYKRPWLAQWRAIDDSLQSLVVSLKDQ